MSRADTDSPRTVSASSPLSLPASAPSSRLCAAASAPTRAPAPAALLCASAQRRRRPPSPFTAQAAAARPGSPETRIGQDPDHIGKTPLGQGIPKLPLTPHSLHRPRRVPREPPQPGTHRFVPARSLPSSGTPPPAELRQLATLRILRPIASGRYRRNPARHAQNALTKDTVTATWQLADLPNTPQY